MHISHVAGNLSKANEESHRHHVITRLISTRASSGRVRREELRNFTFWSLFCAKSGSPRTDGGDLPAILCPGFKLLPKDVGDEALDLVFQAGSIPHEDGKDRRTTAPSQNSDYFLGHDAWRKQSSLWQWGATVGKPLFIKKVWNNPPHSLDGFI